MVGRAGVNVSGTTGGNKAHLESDGTMRTMTASRNRIQRLHCLRRNMKGMDGCRKADGSADNH